MGYRIRELAFSGAALAVVCGAVAFSGAVTREEVVALTHRALDYAAQFRDAPADAMTEALASVSRGESAPPLRPDRPELRMPVIPPLTALAGADPKTACAQGAVAPAVIGDRLKLRIFEAHPASLAPAQPGGAVASTGMAGGGVAFERLDLTGIYDVGADGSLSLPLIGRVAAYGRDLSCLEATLAVEMTKGFGAPLRVSASYDQRPAVVLMGDVRAPGRYDAAAGLRVRDLLGAAGETRISAPDLRHLASLDARRMELESALADTRIEQARLGALLEGRDQFGFTPATYRMLETTLGSDRMALEAAALEARIEEFDADRNRAMRDARTLSRLVEEREANIEVITEQLAILDDRLAELETAQARGVVPRSAVTEYEMNRMDLHRTLIQARMGLIQARADYETMVSAAEMQAARQRSELMMGLRDVARDSAGLSSQLDGVELQIGLESEPEAKNEGMMVRIERRGPDGDSVFQAEMQSELRPGDLVTVRVGTVDRLAQGETDDVRRLARASESVPQ